VQVRVAGLTRSYEGVTALDDVTLEIPAGRTALLGPNGAGKSTLLKILLGLTAPTRGRVEVLGEDPQRNPTGVRARVGYMPEDDAHLPDMTAVELCAYGAELAGLPPREAVERAHGALFHVGIDDKRYLPVQSYSTGLRQKAKLAAAIVHDPDLLFLDEPTNGLDPQAREEMLALVADLKSRRGCDVVLSTHILADVERVCDHVVVLAGGKLMASTPLRELLGGDDRAWRVRVKGDAAALAAALTAASCEVLSVEGPTLVVRTPTAGDPTVIWRAALAGNTQVRHLSPHRTTLDDAFLRLLQ
jgi:ABC-2 type transport system ATP-binding protein